MKLFVAAILISALMPQLASARYSKLQDGHYARVWCTQNKGFPQVTGIDPESNSKVRADCLTSSHVIEVDSAEDWEENLEQAAKYGRAFHKPAKLVLVVEQKSQQRDVEAATKYVASKKLNIEIEAFDVSEMSKAELIAASGEPIVKQSNTGICHVIGVGSHGSTISYTGYDSLQACMDNGGRLPKNVGKTRLLKAERDARKALKLPRKASLASATEGHSSGSGLQLWHLIAIGFVFYSFWSIRDFIPSKKSRAAKKLKVSDAERIAATAAADLMMRQARIPDCPACSRKMVVKSFKMKKRRTMKYWECSNRPVCKGNKSYTS